MRNLILGLALLLSTGVSWAVTSKSPIPPAIQKKFKELDGKKVVVAQLKVDSSLASGDAVSLNVSIPPASLIVRSFVFIKEAVASASNNLISFGCETSADLVAAVAYSTGSNITAGSKKEGIPTGTAATSVYTSDGCTLTANIGPGGVAVTDGYILLPVEYWNVTP